MKCIKITLVCALVSTNLLCMRMTQQGKQYTAKYLQQMKTPQIHKQTELKSEEAQQIPVIFYEPDQKRMILNFVENDTLKTTPISPTQVSFYNFSPQKKYLMVQVITNTASPSQGLSEKTITYLLSSLLKRPIGEKIPTITHVTKIIDLQSLTEVGSFDGDLITYEFSPDETTLIIARRHLDTTHTNEGALPLGARPQNDTTRYELFDISSKSVLKTFENVQTIDYSSEDNLVVQYDNDTLRQITVQRNRWFSSTPNITETINNDLTVSKKITYYDATKELSIMLAHGKKITETHVMAYILSPLKNYLVVFKEKNAMYLINTTTGKKLDNIATNVVTYCFSPDDKETRLVELGAPREFFTGQNIIYSLVNLEKLSSSLTTFTVDNAFYFKSPHELVVVGKNGAFTSYNPQTGIAFEKEQRQNKQQVTQEIKKMGEPKLRDEALQEERQQKTQKELEEKTQKELTIARRELEEEAKKRKQEKREIQALRQKQEQQLAHKAAEQNEEKNIQHQQELQKAYEESLGSVEFLKR